MDAVLLDTDIFSYLTRTHDTRGDAYRPRVAGITVSISFVTVGEIYFGAEKGNRASRFSMLSLNDLKAVVVVPSDHEVCREYGKLKASLREADIVIADNDLWIAACALRHSIPLISNNRKYFEKMPGLNLISLSPGETSPTPKAKGLFEAE